jgi:hypothetical protein
MGGMEEEVDMSDNNKGENERSISPSVTARKGEKQGKQGKQGIFLVAPQYIS